MALRMTIGVRLGLIGVVAVAAVAGLAVSTVSTFGRATHGVTELLIKQEALSNHQTADMMHDAIRGDVLAARLAKDANERAEALKDFEEHAKTFTESIQSNRALDLPADIRATLDDVETPLAEYLRVGRSQLAAETITEEQFAGFMAAFTALEDRMGKASDTIEQAAKSAAETEFNRLRRANTALVTSAVVASFVVVALTFALARSIVVPLRQCVAFFGRVADGDLSQRLDLKRHDELGELAASANKLADGLGGIVTNIGKAADGVGTAASEMASASEQMSRSATEQTHRVEQIVAAVQEMAASVSEVAGRSSDAVANARESGRKAERGGQVVGNAVSEMHAIDSSVSETARLINELGERSQQIGQIVAVIDDIAAQTNLLALNAAIEAARAGEHGRGFAVVADQVRKLADRTTKATEEIAGSITAIREQTTLSVERMQQGSAQVRKGVEQATAAGTSLGEIVQTTAAVSQMIESIAASAEQQRSAGEEVSRAVNEIAGSSRQTQTAVSQGAQTAQQLAERATELKGLIARFKLAR